METENYIKRNEIISTLNNLNQEIKDNKIKNEKIQQQINNYFNEYDLKIESNNKEIDEKGNEIYKLQEELNELIERNNFISQQVI